jgi:hypothetical protein
VTRSFPDGKRGFPRVIYAVLQGFWQIHPPTWCSRAISVPFLDTQEDGWLLWSEPARWRMSWATR